MKSSFFDSLVIFAIFVKILFVLFAILEFYSKIKHKSWASWALYWKQRTEFIFIIAMAFICIVLFNPFSSGELVVDRHVRVLLFIYGIIILITSNWTSFFGVMPPWFQELQTLV